MKAYFYNASARKHFNTAQLLESAMKGASDAGTECEFVNLFDYEFTGCRSCFACKIMNSKTNGVCAIRDSIRPLLESAKDADVLVFGSPVYYGYPTGQLRSFVERLLFPLDTYMVDENGERVKFEHKPIQTGLIYTMNCPEWLMEKVEYPTLLGFTGTEIGRLCGYNEVLYSCDTYQFSDYSKYNCDVFDEKHKSEVRENQFPKDLEKAFDLGKRLVNKV